MRSLILLAVAGLGSFQALPAPAPAAAPPGTDIHLVALTSGLATMREAKPTPVSVAPGYDNQPAFSPDGARILFAANRDGTQTDVFAFDRTSGRVSQLTQTAENENSPTFLPAGLGDAGGFSVVQTEADRSQRLWRFNAAGRNPQLILAEVKPVGYHAWVEPDHLAMFVLGPPSTLQVGRVATGKTDVVAREIGRSLHRIPGTRLVSFVQRETPTEFWIKQIDMDTRQVTPVVRTVEGNHERDYAWMPDGQTIVMSAGSKVWSWMRGATGWTEVYDGAAFTLGAISRLAVSPKGDAVAIVVAEPKRP